jgi:hypothetical protein
MRGHAKRGRRQALSRYGGATTPVKPAISRDGASRLERAPHPRAPHHPPGHRPTPPTEDDEEPSPAGPPHTRRAKEEPARRRAQPRTATEASRDGAPPQDAKGPHRPCSSPRNPPPGVSSENSRGAPVTLTSGTVTLVHRIPEAAPTARADRLWSSPANLRPGRHAEGRRQGSRQATIGPRNRQGPSTGEARSSSVWNTGAQDDDVE